MCKIDGPKPTKCVQFVVNVFEMLTLMCIEHTSTMSPVNKIQDYDYLHQVNGNYQIWSFRGDVYRNKSPKATKCVQLAITYLYNYVNSTVMLYYTTCLNHVAS